VQGFIPAPYMAVYGASKHAIEGYTESLDHEVREYGVRALLVEPAYTRTGFEANSAKPDMPLQVAGISAAGVPGAPRTIDGFETIFGVNHLGHFLLTNLLLNRMGDSGRIVFVTSDLHNPPAFFPVKVSYDNAAAIADRGPGMRAYCTSKLCNIYCAYEMARLLAEQNDRRITVNAFNPGAMSDTGFAAPTGNVLVRGATRVVGGIMGKLIGKQSTSIASGAALARLITDPALATTTGAYIDREAQAPSSPLSHDRDNARELWQASMTMTGLAESDTIFPLTSKAG
jgi:NAD(P)-dependent dehydrogenase (short-subunit alcohol dehydrogenase family)